MQILAHHMFILYLLIAANFLAPLFGCKLQKTLQDSMLLKHLTGFMTLYFFVVLTSQPDVPPWESIAQAFLIYLWFVMTTRTTTRVMALIVVLLFALYMLNTWKAYVSTHPEGMTEQEKDEKLARIEKAQRIIQYVILGLTVLGFAYYLYLKRKEYGGREGFRWSDFLLGRPSCRFDATN